MPFTRFWNDEPDELGSDGFAVQSEDMDLTPMVDVTFLLLIFFMITATFALQGVFAMPPPDREGNGAARTSIEPEIHQELVVRIDASNNVSVDGVPVRPISRLTNVLLSKRSTSVLIVPEAPATHETMVQVLDAARAAGLQRIKIAIASDSR